MEKELTLKIVVDADALAASPVHFANHVTTRVSAEEVFLTFHLRKAHCVDFEAVGPSGQAVVSADPIVTIVLGVPHAIRVGKLLLSQCAPVVGKSKGILDEALQGIEIRTPEEP
ncbi:MAG: hypothetical protein KIS66_13670 [Fimbriimonadaceae bacterium]|nr:hypothetical protein [Fimbriimonadaceae bacterium]